MFPIYCEGPGPHSVNDGMLGTTSIPNVTGYLCTFCAQLKQWQEAVDQLPPKLTRLERINTWLGKPIFGNSTRWT